MQARWTHYRTPGITQRTNKRLNKLMRECLENGGSVEVAIIETARAGEDCSEVNIDFSDKLKRRLVEHAAIVSAQLTGGDVLNM